MTTRAGDSGILLSVRRSVQLESTRSTLVEPPPDPPPVWGPVLVSFFHNLSMGAALLVWIDVCKMAFVVPGSTTAATTLVIDDEASSEPQTLYGRLLAVNAICELFSSQFVGVLSDRVGRRPVQLMAQAGQLIDYAAAALCLPSLGFVGTVPTDFVAPLLFFTRGIAGFLGNYRVSVQSYTSDISKPADCPTRLAQVGGAMVFGMCFGGGAVSVLDIMVSSSRASYILAVFANATNIFIVGYLWRDVAPQKSFACIEANPFAGLPLLASSATMTIYALLIFIPSFALAMYTSSLSYYCETFLKMGKQSFAVLGAEWAILAAVSMSFVQPFLARSVGEIRTIQICILAMTVFFFLFSLLTAQTWWVAYVIIPLFSLSSIAYPMTVGLATREVNAEDQGSLQGAVSVVEGVGKIVAPLLASDVLIPMFKNPGQYHGAVYLVSSALCAPGIVVTGKLMSLTTRVFIDSQVTSPGEGRSSMRGPMVELRLENEAQALGESVH